MQNIPTVKRKLYAFQRGINKVSMINSSWDLFNEIIFIGSHGTTFRTFFFARKFITTMLFVENPSKHYYHTREIMKRWYLFNSVITCRLCILLHKKFNISFNILLLLYGFHLFKQKSKKCWPQHILKEWLRNTKVICSCKFPQDMKSFI